MITLLAVLTVCSALWSQDPFRSALNGAFYSIETLFAFYLIQKFDPKEILSIIMMTGGLVCALGLILIFLFPQVAIVHGPLHPGSWKGVFGDRTSGRQNPRIYLLSPAIIFRRRPFSYRHLIYIALMSLMIFMAQATTARIVLLLYIALMASMSVSSKFGRRSALLLFGMVLVVTASVVYIGLPYLPQVLEGMGKNATLTGRTGIWGSADKVDCQAAACGIRILCVLARRKRRISKCYPRDPLGIRLCTQRYYRNLSSTRSRWNSRILRDTLFQALRNAWFCLRNGCPPGVEWFIGLIALAVVYNIDECTVLWPFDLLSILYVVACCGLARAARQLKEIRKIEAMYS